MQFIKNGPDIPERLLRAHEEGRVVFFCGAGISFPAGLPSFKELVDNLYNKLGGPWTDVQEVAIKEEKFDTAIGLLEAKDAGQREAVRKLLPKMLRRDEKKSKSKATTNHKALLALGETQNDHVHLITTNFDRLFEEVIEDDELTVRRFCAPLLPVPKQRWNGLVYLHGLISSQPNHSELDQLVLSSGDFGLAYLTERWAARFVSELFRAYTVCFIGYSINDAVLRYVMDAIAADRLLGEDLPEVFALGAYSKGRKDSEAEKLCAKNVTPILYPNHYKHFYLRETLPAWAATYRDGVRAKQRIVDECTTYGRPLGSTRLDYYVTRLLWALKDPSGLPAKRFANMNPVPSLDWLDPFCERRYDREGNEKQDPDNSTEPLYSLICRPCPQELEPIMTFVGNGAHEAQLDKVMIQLARWLTRHLNDPKLLLWVVRQRGQLHNVLAGLIRNRLDKLAKLEQEKKTSELKNIRANAPNAIPDSTMRTLWELLLVGYVR